MADGPRYAIEIAAGREVTPEAMSWLRIGFQRYLVGEAGLDVALGLTSTGRKRARNRALCRAAEIIDAGRGLPPWELAGLLARAIARFQAGRLARIRRGVVQTSVRDPIDAALAEAFMVCPQPLTSRERLHKLLTDELPKNRQAVAATINDVTHLD